MAKHTKGPWTALTIGPNNMDDGTAMVATTHRAGMAIDCFRSGATFEESAANACLVAAAPDLLSAAAAVVARWDTPLWKNVPHTAEYINRLRAAIAKATDLEQRVQQMRCDGAI